MVSAQSSSDGLTDGKTVAFHIPRSEENGCADTMLKSAAIGATARRCVPDTLPVGLRLAIAAGLKAERTQPGAASSAHLARSERALIGGLIRTLQRGRRSLPAEQV